MEEEGLKPDPEAED